MNILRQWFIITLLQMQLLGCAMVGIGGNDVEILKERAQARWEALIKKDWDAAYQYELPAYRQTHDVNQFRSKFGSKLQWKHIEAKNAVIVQENKTADVKLNLAYQILLSDGVPMDNEVEINERWVKQEGDWWIAN
jgi:hypothetical protein